MTGAPGAPKPIDWASETQREVFTYGPYPACAAGGFGSAKTYAYCLKSLWLSDTFPQNRGVIARKVARELENTTMSTFFKICPDSAWNVSGKRSDSEYYLRLNNKSEILWLHMDAEDIEGIIRGLEINWFFLDQAEEIDEELVDMLMSRLGRWDVTEVPQWLIAQNGGWDFHNPVTKKPMAPTYAMLACNPDTELHWIYSRFHEDSLDHWAKNKPVIDVVTGKPTGEMESYHDRGYKMFTMSSLDNKFLPMHNRRELLAKDESFRRRFVYGLWGIPEGQIHVVDPLSIIPGTPELLSRLLNNCVLHRVLDHGESSPTCCGWFATDGKGNAFCLGEYYKPNQIISYHRREIYQLTKEVFVGQYSMDLADPSIFDVKKQKKGGHWSVASEYQETEVQPRETCIFWQPADNNELGTRNRINEYLRVDPERVHPITGAKGAPRLFFLKADEKVYPHGCNHILRQVRNQRRLKVGTENGRPIFCDDRDESIPDHGYDPVRYFIASRPALATTATQLRSEKSFEAVRQRMHAFRRAGGFTRMAREAARGYVH